MLNILKFGVVSFLIGSFLAVVVIVMMLLTPRKIPEAYQDVECPPGLAEQAAIKNEKDVQQKADFEKLTKEAK